MKNTDLFQLALGLTPPWIVSKIEFDPDKKQMDIQIDFTKGGQFPCPECGRRDCKAYDTESKKWRHLNFFQHTTFIHARTPRINCPDCGVKAVAVPWAMEGSGFTMLFEAFIMAMAPHMPTARIAALVGEHDTRLWRVIERHVDEARRKENHTNVTKVGIDETSARRGHKYISLFVDIEKSKVLYATEGKDAATVCAFAEDFAAHGGDAVRIKEACIDMSPAFIKGVADNFPSASVTFDKFHVVKIINEAVDAVRREESKSRPELKHSRYALLKNPVNLTEKQRETIDRVTMSKYGLATARAYRMKLVFQDFFAERSEYAEEYLRSWCSWATRSRLRPMVEASRMIRRHWDGILGWFKSGITNGVLEGINSLVQSAKRRARGYRSVKKLITMVYLIAGKLEFGLPT